MEAIKTASQARSLIFSSTCFLALERTNLKVSNLVRDRQKPWPLYNHARQLLPIDRGNRLPLQWLTRQRSERQRSGIVAYLSPLTCSEPHQSLTNRGVITLYWLRLNPQYNRHAPRRHAYQHNVCGRDRQESVASL